MPTTNVHYNVAYFTEITKGIRPYGVKKLGKVGSNFVFFGPQIWMDHHEIVREEGRPHQIWQRLVQVFVPVGQKTSKMVCE